MPTLRHDKGGRTPGEPSRPPRIANPLVARWVATPRLDIFKLTAVVSMLIDHVNTIWFVSRYSVLTAIGRLAFPLFAFVLAYNFVRHTRRPARFVWRLLVWGVISQIFYWYALSGELLNIFFTLGFGLWFAMLFRRGARATLGTTLAVVSLALSTLFAPVGARLDFGIEGMLLVFVFAQVIERPAWWRGALAILFTAMVNAGPNVVMSFLYGLSAVASLVVVAASSKWPGEWQWVRRWRLGFYFFYPAHLFILKTLAPG